MRVALVALLWTLAASVAGIASAQEVERAQGRKDSEKAEAKDQPTAEDLEKMVQGAQDNVEKILDDMSENMREIEKLLEGKDTGASTQKRQQKVLDQLDQLIEQASKT